jgi:regulator of sigma D
LTRCHIDVTSTEHSARFDSLDGHAKMLFDELSENHYSLRDTMTSESAKSAERHAQTTTTILSKQEETQAELISALDSLEDQSRSISEAILENTGSLYDSILVESARADERHEQTTNTIVSTQKETHMDVKQALESMDAASRSEHDTLRREFGEVMQAMLTLRQEILRENNKLKELVMKAIEARSEKERNNVQEQSNAVTFVLCNLMTLYQSLQVLAPIRVILE